MEKKLKEKSPRELRDILLRINEKTGKKMEVPKGKKELINKISTVFQEYSDHQEKKEKRFLKMNQLGEKGRECKAFLVCDQSNPKKEGMFAMKTYRKNKPTNLIRQEHEFHLLAEKAGISPKLVDVDLIGKSMTMIKLDNDLLDIIHNQRGVLKRAQQLRIIEIFKTLDQIGVFHMDANPRNFMEKDGVIYIIDYGYSKAITPRLKSKYGSENLNLDYMTISFVFQLRESYPDINLKYIEKYIDPEAAKKIRLKPM
jgi:predicted Ser/Thr protein kinase